MLENGEIDEDLSKEYKKRLKHLLHDKLSNIVIEKRAKKNKQKKNPEQIMTNETENQAIANFDTTADGNDIKFQWKLSKQTGKEILAKTLGVHSVY